MALGPARDGQAVAAIAAENFQHLLRLWPAQQFLEPPGIFESLLEGLRAFIGVGRDWPPLQPIALLIEI